MGKPMPADDLMDDFPPAPDRLVTLSNWRKAPFSAWGFRNVRRLIPTADIAAGSDTAGPPKSLGEKGNVGLSDPYGPPPPPPPGPRRPPPRAVLRAPPGRDAGPGDRQR